MRTSFRRIVPVLVLSALCAALPLRGSSASSMNLAAAMRWPGWVNTDLAFSEFFGQDHTYVARFLPKYPLAYRAPILTDSGGSSAFFLGMADYRECPIGQASCDRKVKLLLNAAGTARLYPVAVSAAWHHVALTKSTYIVPKMYDGQVVGFSTYTAFKVYLDGQKLCADPFYGACDLIVSGSPAAPSGTLRLGQTGSTTAKNQLYGFVDDVAVFKGLLTQSEIQNLNSNVPRLTGSEAGANATMYAGYTFDSQTPSGGALPAKLARPVTFQQDAVKFPFMSQSRDSAWDGSIYPYPAQDVTMQWPFVYGQEWKVLWGFASTLSHNGYAAFSIDLRVNTANPQIDSCGYAVQAVAAGVVSDVTHGADNDAIVIDHTPNERAEYLHLIKGSVTLAEGASVQAGQMIGKVGTSGPNNCHLHIGFWGPMGANTVPLAFSDYEIYEDGAWKQVNTGIPQTGDLIRKPYLFQF
jgi:murein DD-endopeptidase MepM/ murein hydrolase activator NlpD